MKFVVTHHPYGSEVDVKLHYETKNKIKTNLFRATAVVVSAASILTIMRDRDKKSMPPKED